VERRQKASVLDTFTSESKKEAECSFRKVVVSLFYDLDDGRSSKEQFYILGIFNLNINVTVVMKIRITSTQILNCITN
jgi:hypothetical protein